MWRKMILKSIPIVISAILIALTCTGAYTVYRDIPYYPEGTAPSPERNLLDVYVPDGSFFTSKVMFFVHGGTWMYNDRSDFAPVGQQMSDDERFVTVIPSFRLSDSLTASVVHPAHIQDVAQAFAWTVDNISDYYGDPDRIIVCGHSSGAHLATLLATNTLYLQETGASLQDIKAVISFSMGIYDIPGLYHDLEPWSSMVWGYTPFPNIFSDDTLNWYDASPKYHLHDNMPPFIIFVANEDMEHIIGGNYYDMIYVDGEIDDIYNDFNEFQPTDTFWIAGDHNTSFSNFVFYPACRARNLAMNFVEEVFTDIESNYQAPQDYRLSCCPNPFNASCVIHCPIMSRLELFDMTGASVLTIEPSEYRDGFYHWSPDPSMGTGVYLISAPEQGMKRSLKIIYLK
ncbi:alpha/beta hydrolase [bacterium]|nr:alpha/beta hydrolase [bacterium]